MMVQYSETAEVQLIEIWRYSRRRWGDGRADKYVASLYEAVRLAAEGRRRVQPRPEVRPELSLIRSGSHHIYVAVDAERQVMRVVGVLHQRMEPRRHILKTDEGE
jgi:toxin ParE1/3/4